jgi:hypothetical protein
MARWALRVVRCRDEMEAEALRKSITGRLAKCGRSFDDAKIQIVVDPSE